LSNFQCVCWERGNGWLADLPDDWEGEEACLSRMEGLHEGHRVQECGHSVRRRLVHTITGMILIPGVMWTTAQRIVDRGACTVTTRTSPSAIIRIQEPWLEMGRPQGIISPQIMVGRSFFVNKIPMGLSSEWQFGNRPNISPIAYDALPLADVVHSSP
jgi:hypothetical protein